MPVISVVVAEDHALVREGTRRILDGAPDIRVVGEAGDGQAALEQTGRHRPDVLLIDINMEPVTGIEAVQMLREQGTPTRVIVLSACDDDAYVLEAMQAGASGYLLQPVRANELIEAVRSVARGETVLQPAVASKVARLWRTGTPRPILSVREKDVLRLVAQGLDDRDIACALGLTPRAVERHLGSIFDKLNVSSRTGAVLDAIDRGWLAQEGKASDRR